MGKTIVIYRSKSGFTKKYAHWIAQETGALLCDARNADIKNLAEYDTIVFGGALYASGINGVRLITKNFDVLKGKKIIVFTLGATPVREVTRQELLQNNFTKEQRDNIDFFMLRGGFSYEKLGTFDKLLMILLKLKLKAKKHPTADERGMLASYSQPVDFTDIKYIKPIIDAISK